MKRKSTFGKQTGDVTRLVVTGAPLPEEVRQSRRGRWRTTASHVSERTGERYTRDEIQYAVFEHLWIPGAEVAVYDAKAVPPEFREEQRRRARRIVVEIERAMEALPLRDWKRVLARAERSAGRGPWNRGRRPESGRR